MLQRARSSSSFLMLVTLILATTDTSASSAASATLRVLVIDGPDPAHKTAITSALTEQTLEAADRFGVKRITVPKANVGDDAWEAFDPKFTDYQVVVLDHWVSEDWPDRLYARLEQYVADGGGLVVIHSALASFPSRESFARMIGLAWRRQAAGVGLSFDELGRLVRRAADPNGKSGHGPIHAFALHARDRRHPITADLPETWLHGRDELYDGLRGPAEQVTVLASAYSNRTGKHEPALWVTRFGKGRVFATVLGHDATARQCVGHQTTLLRGCEWAATGTSTFATPINFPAADRSVCGQPHWPNARRPKPDAINRHIDPSVKVFGRYGAVKLPVTNGVPLHNPTALAVGDDGAIFVANYTGQILRLTDSDDDGLEDTATLFADVTRHGDGACAEDAARYPGVPAHGNLRYPTAMTWRDGRLYVATTQEVRVYRDSNGDGEAETSSTFVSGWPFNMHYFCWTFGCKFGPDGHLYLSLCSDYHIANAPPDPNRLRGAVLRVSPDGKTVEKFADGLRYPYGMAFNETGELFVSDNKGGGNNDEELNHVVRGGNYGHNPHGTPENDRVPRSPTLAIRYGTGSGGMTFNRPDNDFGGAGGDLFITMWGPDGQWGVGSIVRVQLERQPDGSYRAIEHRFAEGPAKVIDACFSPDGDLYVAQFGREGPRHVPYSEPEGGVYRFIHAPWVAPTTAPVNPLNRSLVGDPSNGQLLFEQRGCRLCHATEGQSVTLGPDLSDIGAILNLQGLRDSLDNPSASIKTDFDTHQLHKTDGQVLIGRLLASSDEAVRLMTAGNQVVTIARDEIQRLTTIPMSMMPPGLLAGLEAQQVNDLLAYMQTLRRDQPLLRLNCGGERYQDADERRWLPDQPYQPGGFGAVSGAISRHDELDEPIAQSCRFGDVHYRFDADNGEYEVTLWMAEPAFRESGKRVFSLFVQDRPVIEDLDLVKEVGFAKPYRKTVRISVTDGGITIRGKAKVNHALLSAIEISAVTSAINGASSAAPPAEVNQREGDRSFQWRHEPDRSLSLLLHGQPLWTLHFDPNEDKPYLHPLRTVGGANLTWHRPSDHPWHRALWFSWKTINGVNYWEEDTKTGLSPGRSRVKNVNVKTEQGGRAVVVIDLAYHPHGKADGAVMTERRTVTFGSPDQRGDYHIDFHQSFQAGDAGVTLDRTDPAKQGWGGYAGLSLRADAAIRDWQFLDSEGRRDQAISSKQARWVDLSGVFGKAGDQAEGKPAGITIIDHADNPRHPSPWYVVIRDAKDGPFVYFNAALLYHEPLTLKPGEKLNLTYRVLVHDGPAEPPRIERDYDEFNAAPQAKR